MLVTPDNKTQKSFKVLNDPASFSLYLNHSFSYSFQGFHQSTWKTAQLIPQLNAP